MPETVELSSIGYARIDLHDLTVPPLWQRELVELFLSVSAEKWVFSVFFNRQIITHNHGEERRSIQESNIP